MRSQLCEDLTAKKETGGKKNVLTKNCSRCLSDSGVNSEDMGVTSPPRMMIALRVRGKKTKTITTAKKKGPFHMCLYESPKTAIC